MSNFLIVGPATSSLKQYLHAEGHSFTRLIDRKQTKLPDVTLNDRLITDFSDKNTYLQAAADLHTKLPINGVLVTYENSVLAAAHIAEYLRLPGLPIDAAEACTDKFLMRQKFMATDPSISPDFMVVEDEAGLKSFADAHTYPLILKPANLAKSLLVTKNSSWEELQENFKKTQEQIGPIYQKYSPHRPPKILVEEFMEGSIHSVDAFVDAAGTPHILDQVVDYQTGYDVGFDDNFHYSRLLPSKLPAETIAAIKKTADTGCRALNIKNSPAHIEIIVTPTGPKIVEIGARNGGYRERMHRVANGIELLGAYIDTSLGKVPNIAASRNDNCAVLELFPKLPGTFMRIKGEEAARLLPSYVQLHLKVEPGELVGKAADGYKMCAMIMLHNDDAQQFDRDLTFITSEVSVETR